MAVDEDEKITVAAAQAQFDNWVDEGDGSAQCPSLSVIGNHDIFWKDAKSSPAGDPEAAAQSRPTGCRTDTNPHQVGGWKFLLLDTFHADGCRIDDRSSSWLERELTEGTGPIALVSHAPILDRHRLPRIEGRFPGQIHHS